VLESLDAAYLPFSRACQVAMQCEQLRAAVFGGERAPLVLGEPQTWLAQLIESNRLLAHGETEASADLRAQAFEGASTSSGALNGTPFSWLADQDSRLGPTLELYLDAKYYWVPISHISRLKCLAPQTTRDLIWSTVEVTWSTGGESVALMPVRYPGTEVAHDDALRLSRRTEWRTAGGDFYCGTGQRVLGIDDADVGVLDVREIVIEPAG
jgi:type VI secretion system protein ImpE